MASGMTPTKKLIVRTTLVTGSTLAVILGAQALVLQSTQQDAANPPPATPLLEMAEQPTAQVVPSQAITNAAPNIVILRHSPQTVPSTVNTSSPQAAQPSPVQRQSTSIQPPAPVVVQVQPQTIIQASGPSASIPTTHSTR